MNEAVLFIALIAFIANLPFGFLRTTYKRFSLGWFICIHAPIPIVVALRLLTKTSYVFIPIFLATSIAGQLVGSRLSPRVGEEPCE